MRAMRSFAQHYNARIAYAVHQRIKVLHAVQWPGHRTQQLNYFLVQ
jgi:hypothetical protein